jgi:hypothetical protein
MKPRCHRHMSWYVFMYVCVHACMHACIHTYILSNRERHTCKQTYIHTYIHTYILLQQRKQYDNLFGEHAILHKLQSALQEHGRDSGVPPHTRKLPAHGNNKEPEAQKGLIHTDDPEQACADTKEVSVREDSSVRTRPCVLSGQVDYLEQVSRAPSQSHNGSEIIGKRVAVSHTGGMRTEDEYSESDCGSRRRGSDIDDGSTTNTDTGSEIVNASAHLREAHSRETAAHVGESSKHAEPSDNSREASGRGCLHGHATDGHDEERRGDSSEQGESVSRPGDLVDHESSERPSHLDDELVSTCFDGLQPLNEREGQESQESAQVEGAREQAYEDSSHVDLPGPHPDTQLEHAPEQLEARGRHTVHMHAEGKPAVNASEQVPEPHHDVAHAKYGLEHDESQQIQDTKGLPDEHCGSIARLNGCAVGSPAPAHSSDAMQGAKSAPCVGASSHIDHGPAQNECAGVHDPSIKSEDCASARVESVDAAPTEPSPPPQQQQQQQEHLLRSKNNTHTRNVDAAQQQQPQQQQDQMGRQRDDTHTGDASVHPEAGRMPQNDHPEAGTNDVNDASRSVANDTRTEYIGTLQRQLMKKRTQDAMPVRGAWHVEVPRRAYTCGGRVNASGGAVPGVRVYAHTCDYHTTVY